MASHALENQLKSVLGVPLLANLLEPELGDEGSGGDVAGTDAGSHDCDGRIGPRPIEEDLERGARIPAATEGRVDGVPHLGASRLVRRAMKSGAADGETAFGVDDRPGDPSRRRGIIPDLRGAVAPRPPGIFANKISAQGDGRLAICGRKISIRQGLEDGVGKLGEMNASHAAGLKPWRDSCRLILCAACANHSSPAGGAALRPLGRRTRFQILHQGSL